MYTPQRLAANEALQSLNPKCEFSQRHDEEVVNRWLGLARSLEPLLGVLHGPLAPFAAALQCKSPRPVVRADGATRQRTQVPLRSIPFAPCTGAKTCVAAPRVAAGRLAECLESIFDR